MSRGRAYRRWKAFNKCVYRIKKRLCWAGMGIECGYRRRVKRQEWVENHIFALSKREDAQVDLVLQLHSLTKQKSKEAFLFNNLRCLFSQIYSNGSSRVPSVQ